jgi:hypothetical protein
VRLDPVVTRVGQPFTLSLHATGGSRLPIHMHLSGLPDRLRRNGVELDSVVLRDNGTNGDAVAGDRWFTLDGLVLPTGSTGLAAVSPNSVQLHEQGEAHGDESVFIAVAFRTADPAVLGSPPITEIAPDARATSRVVSLVHSSARVLGENGLPSIIRRYYDLFPDDRDFLVVLIPPTVRTGEVWGARAYVMQNDVEGLGMNIAKFRDFGPHTQLDVVVHSRLAGYSSQNPAGGFCLLTHELSHRWVAYIGGPLADQTAHWIPGRIASQHSALGDSHGCRFNELELFLAGLLPADSISTPFGPSGYALAELVATHGPRRPAAGEAQRDFTIGFIVVTDAPLDDHEMAYFNYIVGEYTAESSVLGPNWFVATGGRSRLSAER